MDNTDRPEFMRMLGTVAVTLGVEVDEPTLELYYRALRDVPIALLRRASVDLARTSRFMPKPAEFRIAVDKILDKRGQAALHGATQAQLPGDVGEFRCEACGNTGFVSIEKPCDRGEKCAKLKPGHTHTFATRCTDTACVQMRQRRAEQRRRYSRAGAE